jgi:hypothetical protein
VGGDERVVYIYMLKDYNIYIYTHIYISRRSGRGGRCGGYWW